MPKDNLAFALDFPSLQLAQPTLASLSDVVGYAKIGLELFTREGPAALRLAQDLGFHVFLDLKLHDIPETVERAVANACALGVRLLTLHLSGGPTMIERAVRRCAKENSGLTLVGVTVLTSLDAQDLAAIGISATVSDHAQRLARLGSELGMGAYVCSAHEVATFRSLLGATATLVTPGIRPSGGSNHDQKRAATPTQAIVNGADLLVVGRPIRDSAQPACTARDLLLEIDAALAQRTRC
jgi:orotidine-5'-phosphate decarboxylase